MRLPDLLARAAGRSGGPWAAIGSLVAGGVVAGAVIRFLPVPTGRLERAREMGIVSVSIIQGYSKDYDTLAYVVGLPLAVACALALWALWAWWIGAAAEAPSSGAGRFAPTARASLSRLETVAVPLVLFGLFHRGFLARAFWSNPFVLLAEEGEMMAWVDTALRGGVLYRDVFCLYGPLSKLPLLLLFRLLEPSVVVWRLWLYTANAAALVACWALLRLLLRGRAAAFASALLLGWLCVSPVPAMSWSLARVATGLTALLFVGLLLDSRAGAGAAAGLRAGTPKEAGGGAANGSATGVPAATPTTTLTAMPAATPAATLTAMLTTPQRGWLWGLPAGCAFGISLFYSQEVGLAAALGVAAAFAAAALRGRELPRRRDLLRAATAMALGLALVLIPLGAALSSQGALTATLRNLFFFPRTRVLGFGGHPFPSLWASLSWWAAGGTPEPFMTVLRTAMFYVVPAIYVAAAFVLLLRLATRRRDEEIPLAAGVLVFGVALFSSALSRPDPAHVLFAAPPAVLLLAELSERAVLGLRGGGGRTRRAACVLLLAAAAAAFLALHGFARVMRRAIAGADVERVPIELPRAGGAQAPPALATGLRDAIRYVQERTRPEDPLWAFPNEAMINFLADRPVASPFVLGLFAITRAQREEMIAALDRSRPPYAIMYLEAPLIDGIPYSVALPEVLAYLEHAYTAEQRFGPFVVARRTAPPLVPPPVAPAPPRETHGGPPR